MAGYGTNCAVYCGDNGSGRLRAHVNLMQRGLKEERAWRSATQRARPVVERRVRHMHAAFRSLVRPSGTGVAARYVRRLQRIS